MAIRGFYPRGTRDGGRGGSAPWPAARRRATAELEIVVRDGRRSVNAVAGHERAMSELTVDVGAAGVEPSIGVASHPRR
jgi:hypothetical protein